jgi:APA family basic amino acid/polyamine antiporter
MTLAGKLRRSLGLLEVTLSGVGIILGAGVYTLIGPASALAGNALWLAFTLAGVAALCTVHAYARLGPVRARNAPEFQYTSMAFGPQAGFVAGWLVLATNILGASAVSLSFGGYLTHLTGVPWAAGAAGIVAVSAAVALSGTRESVWAAAFFTLAEVSGLLAVTALGLPHAGNADLLETPQGFTGVATAASLVFFAYIGFGQIGNLAEEMQQPERDLPRAYYLAMAITAAIYISTSVAASAVAGWQALSASNAPMALVAGQLLGPSADAALSIVALAATGNTVLMLVVSSARLLHGMAQAGALPRALRRVGPTNVPDAATLVVALSMGALLAIGDVGAVAALTNGAVLTSLLLVNASLLALVMRRRLAGGWVRRMADLLAAGIGAGLCLLLLWLTGWASLGVTALLVAAAAVVAAVRRPEPLENGGV